MGKWSLARWAVAPAVLAMYLPARTGNLPVYFPAEAIFLAAATAVSSIQSTGTRIFWRIDRFGFSAVVSPVTGGSALRPLILTLMPFRPSAVALLSADGSLLFQPVFRAVPGSTPGSTGPRPWAGHRCDRRTFRNPGTVPWCPIQDASGIPSRENSLLAPRVTAGCVSGLPSLGWARGWRQSGRR